MKIYFLGTNGWYSSPTGNTACVLVDSQEGYIIFDAGNGLYRVVEHIREKKPVYLFISHFHIDHISGIHSVATKTPLIPSMNVFMAQGRKKDFEGIFNPPYTSPKTSLKVNELSEGKHSSPFPIEIIKQFHTYIDHGYRVTLEGKTIAYSGDCGISEGSLPLAKDVDLLIHECSYTEPEPPPGWGHVNSAQAATLAKEANAKKLILTHFDPTKYPNLEKRKEAEQLAQEIFPETIAATDELIVEI